MGVRSGEDTRYFRGNKEKVWKEVLQTLSERKFSIQSINEGAGEIEASSGLSFLSSGARLNILVTPVNRETTRVRVSGKAKGITLIDYGRSAREARAVLAGLEERIPAVDLRMDLEEEVSLPRQEKDFSKKILGASCAQCGASLEENSRFCSVCGAPVEKASGTSAKTCTSCGAPLGEGARFCGSCGSPAEK